MSTSTPTNNTNATTTTTTAPSNTTSSLEQLPALQEDDEFEEFPSQDWDDSATYQSVLSSKSAKNVPGSEHSGTATNGTAGEPKQGLDSLWEDNWDDDDVSDDFSLALREQLRKQNQMQT